MNKGLAIIVCGLLSVGSVNNGLGANLDLRAALSADNRSVAVSWDSELTNYYVLQKSRDVAGPWENVNESTAVSNLSFLVSPGPSSYYRLTEFGARDRRIPTNGLVAEYLFNINTNGLDSAVFQGRRRDATESVSVRLTTNHLGIPQCAYQFNGTNAYIAIANDRVFSIRSNASVSIGSLSISAWMRPDTNTFPKSDGPQTNGQGEWVYWLSKVQDGGACGTANPSQDEWALRMYNRLTPSERENCDTNDCPNCVPGETFGRTNWVSAYAFNLCLDTEDNFGAGSRTGCRFPTIIGEWAHYVVTFQYSGNAADDYGLIQWFKDGVRIDHDSFIYHKNLTDQVIVHPLNGTARVRIGKGSGEFYFMGAVDNVRFYNRVLTPDEIVLLRQDITP